MQTARASSRTKSKSSGYRCSNLASSESVAYQLKSSNPNCSHTGRANSSRPPDSVEGTKPKGLIPILKPPVKRQPTLNFSKIPEGLPGPRGIQIGHARPKPNPGNHKPQVENPSALGLFVIPEPVAIRYVCFGNYFESFALPLSQTGRKHSNAASKNCGLASQRPTFFSTVHSLHRQIFATLPVAAPEDITLN